MTAKSAFIQKTRSHGSKRGRVRQKNQKVESENETISKMVRFLFPCKGLQEGRPDVEREIQHPSRGAGPKEGGLKALVRGGTKGRPLREPGRGAVEHHQFAEGRLSVFNLALGGFQSRLNPAGSTLRHSGTPAGAAGNFSTRARARNLYTRGLVA